MIIAYRAFLAHVWALVKNHLFMKKVLLNSEVIRLQRNFDTHGP
jgi:hypothetical protein